MVLPREWVIKYIMVFTLYFGLLYGTGYFNLFSVGKYVITTVGYLWELKGCGGGLLILHPIYYKNHFHRMCFNNDYG